MPSFFTWLVSARSDELHVGKFTDFSQTPAGVRTTDREGSGHDICQLEGAHHVQHQTAQVIVVLN